MTDQTLTADILGAAIAAAGGPGQAALAQVPFWEPGRQPYVIGRVVAIEVAEIPGLGGVGVSLQPRLILETPAGIPLSVLCAAASLRHQISGLDTTITWPPAGATPEQLEACAVRLRAVLLGVGLLICVDGTYTARISGSQAQAYRVCAFSASVDLAAVARAVQARLEGERRTVRAELVSERDAGTMEAEEAERVRAASSEMDRRRALMAPR